MPYRCPLCFEPLHAEATGLRCANRHHFDRAREGYVHLLPVQRKHSKAPGDDASMIQARRRFLDAGHFAALREELSARLLARQPGRMLDIGCGEGHYTGAFAEALAQTPANPPKITVYGMDISKPAVRLAAKRHRSAAFCVASIRELPYLDSSFDLVSRIYAPSEPSELHRVIRPGGELLIVTPGKRHLHSLRELLYAQVQEHDEEDPPPPGFALTDSAKIGHRMTLDGAQALDLLRMTPFAWRADESLRQQIAKRSRFDCEAEFLIRHYRRL
ncbi:hypothetical protein A5892_12130 [Halotalea alkalilenta]|uniref:Uncharacterized protein n=2 Tax=Halotalea alkalilenta TaxID=376489 RepID=A0A172YKE2_9GAMM|nr:hypothetical protein A5892_12130 [Halotalea alkalilenta]